MKKDTLLKSVFLVLLSLASFAWAKEKVPFTRQSLRDPFIAPEGFEKIEAQEEVLLEKILGDVKIMGIMIDGNKRYVIINNSIVKEKEAWQELLIDKIEKDRLTVIYRGRSTTIPYKKGI